jgi:hypothetical protein
MSMVRMRIELVIRGTFGYLCSSLLDLNRPYLRIVE